MVSNSPIKRHRIRKWMGKQDPSVPKKHTEHQRQTSPQGEMMNRGIPTKGTQGTRQFGHLNI